MPVREYFSHLIPFFNVCISKWVFLSDKAAALEAFDESGKNSQDYNFETLLGKGAAYVGKKLGRWVGKKINGDDDEN